jgi:hypothetical protein
MGRIRSSCRSRPSLSASLATNLSEGFRSSLSMKAIGFLQTRVSLRAAVESGPDLNDDLQEFPKLVGYFSRTPVEQSSP